jgi:GcvH upstream region-like protein
MLTFFRKYQKAFFIFTTTIIVVSFLFFGVAGSMGGPPEVKEVPLLKAIDGSTVSVQKLQRMVHFLSSSQLDLKDDKTAAINLLNDGVLEKQFLAAPLGRLLAEKISSEIEKDVKQTIEKAAGFQPYRYAGAPFVSSESIWAQFAPESTKIVGELMTHASALSPLKKFDLLSQGYLQHQAVPATFIRKVLSYQAQQMGMTEQDPALAYADVSLMGLHSAKDWLGEAYLKAAAQVIINGAASAKRAGYSVSTQEARDSMVLNVKKAAELLLQETNAQTNFYQIFLNQVRNLGMNEAECIDLWKEITLFQKFFGSQNLDVKSLPEPENISKSRALAQKYTLPSSLQFKDFMSFMKLQVYVDAVSAKKRSRETLLELPTELLSLADIEKKAPELVQRDYVLEYAELDVRKAASQIGLKETWSYQTQEEGWKKLRKQYPDLQAAETKEERFAVLEALDPKLRLEMDKFSREQILFSSKDRIQKELALAKQEVRSFGMSSKGAELPFKIADRQALVTLLEAAPLKGSQDPIQEKLNCYTQDQQHYYKISVVERSPFKKIQTFAEANASGALRRMLDKKLEDSYFEVRRKDPAPYMKKDGAWKPLSEVKESLGLTIFAPVLKAIGAEYQAVYGKEPSKEQLDSSDFYVQNWMLFHLKDSLAKIQAGILEQSQWQLVSKQETLAQKDHESLSDMSFVEGTWSPIVSLTNDNPCFFKIVQKLEAVAPSQEEIEKITAPMRREAEKKLFEQLFSEMETKKAISFQVLKS